MTSGQDMGPIVVGMSGSKTTRAAVERAVEFARQFGVPLHVVGVARPKGKRVISGPGRDEWTLDAAEGIRDRLKDFVSQWSDIETSVAAPEGKPAQALIDEADRLDASMIVVGNRRMQGKRRVLGSVASDVAHHANCDVHIVNTSHRADPGGDPERTP